MNDTDHAIRLDRIRRIEAFLDSRFPEWNAPTPAPDFRVGDLVEVVEDRQLHGTDIEYGHVSLGERFRVVEFDHDGDIVTGACLYLHPWRLRLISRP